MSKSISMYKVDPNNSEKQIPNSPDFTKQFNKATTPAKTTITEAPNQVILNTAGTYAFAYQSGSISTYITGSVVASNAGPVVLDIQPVAWRRTTGTDGDVGDVTFVYKGVK